MRLWFRVQGAGVRGRVEDIPCSLSSGVKAVEIGFPCTLMKEYTVNDKGLHRLHIMI